jgi:hypothetical protein
VFYTTPTDDGAIAVTCDLCYAATSCPDPWAAAAAITHHRCQPDTAIASIEDHGGVAPAGRPLGCLLPRLRVPARHRHQPSPLRTPGRPQDLSRLPRGDLTCRS